MKRNSLCTLAAATACLGLVLPPGALANDAGHPQPADGTLRVVDVALRNGGLLVGQVVDPQGMPQANAVVAIRYADREVVRTTTDADGVFAAQGLRGGQYQLTTDGGQSICRLWAVDTAPPAARQTALIVKGDQLVRGQFGYRPVHDWVEWMKCHPYLTAGAVAAAIAVPIALANDWTSGS